MPDWARRWQRPAVDNGWLLAHSTAEFGGRNATVCSRYLYLERLWQNAGIYHSLQPQGVEYHFAASLIFSFGSAEQKQRGPCPFLRRDTTRNRLGMSEPSAGSDRASLRTKAVHDGDHFVGQRPKVWTSGCAHGKRTTPEVHADVRAHRPRIP